MLCSLSHRLLSPGPLTRSSTTSFSLTWDGIPSTPLLLGLGASRPGLDIKPSLSGLQLLFLFLSEVLGSPVKAFIALPSSNRELPSHVIYPTSLGRSGQPGQSRYRLPFSNRDAITPYQFYLPLTIWTARSKILSHYLPPERFGQSFENRHHPHLSYVPRRCSGQPGGSSHHNPTSIFP